MTTKEFLISNWPLHGSVIVLAATIVGIFVVQKRDEHRRSNYSWFFLWLAVGMLFLSLDSPLEALADGYLFSAHMLQHLLLLLVIPALLVCAFDPGCRALSSKRGEPNVRFRESEVLKRLRNGLTHPLITWTAGVGTMWFWHVPTLCNAATSIPWLRGAQTLSLLGLGVLFWLPIFGPNRQRRLPPLGGVLYLFTACIGCTLLGIILTFAPVSVCSVYLHPADKSGVLPMIRNDWGLTPALDQQIGGLLMWVPACLTYLCGIMALLARWYAGPTSEPVGNSPAVAPTHA